MRPASHWPWLLLILAFAFVTRFWRVEYPPRYIFDEVYHAVTAKLIARGDVQAYEWWHPAPEPNTAIDWLHPPLAKYTQAISMKVFGENSFGWRFSSVVFGTAVVGAVYVLTQLAFRQRGLSLLAAALSSLDGLLLVQSRIAMNDIHVTFFILLTLIVYFIYRQYHQVRYLLLTGVCAGLAMGTKWSGVYVLGAVGFVEAIEYLREVITHHHVTNALKKAGLLFVSLLVIPSCVYILSYTHMFILESQKMSMNGVIHHFIDLHKQIWWYQTNLKATHSYQSRPWQWFFDLRPVWYHVDYVSDTMIGNIYAFGNPLLFWFADVAIVFTPLYLLARRVKGKLVTPETNLLIILLTYGAVWLPWIQSPRIMFFYHYTPAVPLLCIILGYWLWKVWQLKVIDDDPWNKIVVGLVVFLIAGAFAVWYPQWTAIPVSKTFAKSVYYRIESWK